MRAVKLYKKGADKMLIKKCPTCNKRYSELEMYCTKCGIKLVKDKNRCSNPKTRLCECAEFADDDLYCAYCGSPTTYAMTKKHNFPDRAE